MTFYVSEELAKACGRAIAYNEATLEFLSKTEPVIINALKKLDTDIPERTKSMRTFLQDPTYTVTQALEKVKQFQIDCYYYNNDVTGMLRVNQVLDIGDKEAQITSTNLLEEQHIFLEKHKDDSRALLKWLIDHEKKTFELWAAVTDMAIDVPGISDGTNVHETQHCDFIENLEESYHSGTNQKLADR